MLETLSFKAGAGPGSPNLVFPIDPSVTIFVGPNNSGKSLALREIAMILGAGIDYGKTFVVDNLEYSALSEWEARAYLSAHTVRPSPGDLDLPPNQLDIRDNSGTFRVNSDQFVAAVQQPNMRTSQHRGIYASWYGGRSILSMDGPSRVMLTNPQEMGDLKNADRPFARLLLDDRKREQLRRLILEATGLHFALDTTQGGHIRIRFGRTPPPNERSLEDPTIDYMREATAIEALSDGIKAFTGMLVQLHAGTHKIVLVDEPEAFLHPSLAFKLGREIARGAVDEGKFIFASTHSPQFLMGAISSGAKINVVRVTYDGGEGTARLLRSADLTRMMRNPLLRSVGVLEGLFHSHVVVGEADADRAFYQEINHRLTDASDQRGTLHTLFLNANGKHTIPAIVAPLRRLGIPAAAIADIDLLKLGGTELISQLDAIGVPKVEREAYQAKRRAVNAALVEAQTRDYKLEGGLNLLTGDALEAADNLVNDLARYGLFVVPRGEIENWLDGLDIPRSKSSWLRQIFEAMGEDPRASNYVAPSDGDVWDFMGRVSDWLRDHRRRGMFSGERC
ncbi:AAA family ATPase [Rhizobium changzhiense]|uniref:ATP-dependent nuclease n=1 Tax=Rhizobium changzhiense TaxID=2692317 RepID=UPI001F0BDEE1|nr:AAA family ATPase [Rhizobium changzhiense]MCH4545924.1 AAA family ATPase [Rhizobium changzhiense]